MEYYLILASSVEAFLAEHGKLILSTTIVLLTASIVVKKYGPKLYLLIEESSLGLKLGLITADELRHRESDKRFEIGLKQLEKEFFLAKQDSERLPQAEDYGLEEGDIILPNREKRFKVFLKQVKAAIRDILEIRDSARMNYRRQRLAQVIRGMGVTEMGDGISVDASSAIHDLTDILQDLENTKKEIFLAEDEAHAETEELPEEEETSTWGAQAVKRREEEPAAETPVSDQKEASAPTETPAPEYNEEEADDEGDEPRKELELA